MFRVWIAPVVALALAAAAGPAGDDVLAPDGRRGLGSELSLQDFHSLVRSDEPDDVEFLGGLYALEGDIRIQVALIREHYRSRGYFELLGRGHEDDLEKLHGAYLSARQDPLLELDRGKKSGRALARMLCDTRFNVRLELLANFDFEAREVRAGLGVLRSTTDGWTSLTPEETRQVLTRVDLAASLLRALRSDLLALRSTSAAKEEDSDEVRELLELERLREVSAQRDALRAVLTRCDQRAERMRQALFQTRLLPKIRTLLTWREEDLRRAQPLRLNALTHLPDTPEGRAASGGVTDLARHDRMRYALVYGQEGLAFDPLDEDLAWAAAEGTDFLWGDRQSRPLYDRFLALRGIRSHDHRTIAGKDLGKREQRALYVVQQPMVPGVGR